MGSGTVSLPTAYQKYKAFHKALKKLEEMVLNGTWTGPKPNQGELKDLFASRSFFGSHYVKFKSVGAYPDLVKWLDSEPDKLSDEEVWGIDKSTYTFADLVTYMNNGGTLNLLALESDQAKGKRKGKGKEREKTKDKVKNKDKGDKRKETTKKGESSSTKQKK